MLDMIFGSRMDIFMLFMQGLGDRLGRGEDGLILGKGIE
jgi:hypothetical protein